MVATRARARKPAGAVRQDPRSRHVDGASPWTIIENRDPSRHYVYVWPEGQNQDMDVGYYVSMGYEVEELRPGGPKPRAGCTSKMGEPVEARGLVLVSCSAERRAEIEQFGPDGTTGQARADEIEDRILDKRGGNDHLRGLGGPRLGVQNETGALEAEA